MKRPGHPVRPVKRNPVFLVRLLNAGHFEVFEDHLGEVGGQVVAVRRLALAFGRLEDVDEFLVPIHGERCDAATGFSTVNGPATRMRALSTYALS